MINFVFEALRLQQKREMRDRADLHVIQGKRNFKDKKQPLVLDNTSVAVFHGEPHPHEVQDEWVKENWR